ncbi:helix-turn-helix domain-containing protein [Spirosoma utsteinense]|uniref:Excisionase family DNA binding protein n=1 Tax=Spirosoma utsteinense TaxID=2585773 RepID=A0ABR6W1F9_9BACT|nr:helix-turn-helix domain-containing protein [Spirosoma utsteinense]MBC3784951.1 excisionase family DNA binding protein [Spirosoma utsteinense]MBC3790441.1 excisionase family DNA binding protein [Spirosoma utsteinense]
MQTQPISFDQLPSAVYELSRKVDHLTLLLSQSRKIPEIPPQSQDLLTIKQASEHVNLAVPTIYALVGRRGIPFMKKDGIRKLYFSREELTKWVQEGRRKTATELQAEVNADLMSRNA